MEYYLISWQEAAVDSLNQFLSDFFNALPDIIGALIITIIGLSMSFIAGRLTRKFIDYIGLDAMLAKTDYFKTLSKRGVDFHTSEMLSFSVRWFFFLITLFTAANILKWVKLTEFLKSVVLYLPNVVIAIFIIAIGLVIGDRYHITVRKTVKALRLPAGSARILGELARWSILIFTSMAALTQLGVATELIKILFTGFVTMVSLAGGLAFGLGGKDLVREWLLVISEQEKKPAPKAK